jgi:hypothetical protein
MTIRIMLALLVAVAVPACGSKDDDAPAKKNGAGGGGAGKKDGPPRIDPNPTLSWTEQRGPGFVVTAARAPSEAPAPTKDKGVVKKTVFSGYEPEGAPGAFTVTVTELAKPTGEPDLLKILRDEITAPKADPNLTVDDLQAMNGTPPGMEAVYSGTDEKLGEIKMRIRVFYKDNVLYTAVGKYSMKAKKDFGPQAQTFVDSLKVQ